MFFENAIADLGPMRVSNQTTRPAAETPLPNMEAKYRALVEQIPAVVFMASLDEGTGKPMSVLRSNRCSGLPKRNGYRTRFAGIGRCILKTSNVGAWKRRNCFSRASLCDPPTACCHVMEE